MTIGPMTPARPSMRLVLAACFLLCGVAQAMEPLRQGTAPPPIPVGPFASSTSPFGAATGLALSQADFKLSKNGGAQAQKSDTSSATHLGNGMYAMQLNATDTNTVGTLNVSVEEAGTFAYQKTFQVLPARVYDKLYGSGADGPATAAENRSIAQSAADSLVFTPTNGETGVQDLSGMLPIPGTASYEAVTLAVASTWRRLCPVERATTYYFDAQNGNDANSGLTTALPKQTISAMNTLLSGGNVHIYAKGTWRHAASAGVTMPANTSLTRWPDKSPYRITGCRLEQDAGSVTWTNAAGNRWSATIANAAHLHPKSWGIFRYLTAAASTAEVEANSYSYYITGSTVHVNMGGTNPNTIDFELTHTSDYGSLASGVTVTGGGVFIEGGTFDHNGYGAYAVGVNQSYGVVCNQTGESVVYIKDCQFGGHYYHNVGTLSGSGGRTLIENCVAGGCRDDIATHINFFATSGGNEAIALRCRVVTDRMPRVGMAANNAQEAFFGHTSSGNVDFMAILHCELTADGQDPAQSLGRFNNVPTPTKGDPSTYRCCFHRCRTKPGIGSRTVPWLSNSAYVACDIAIRPAQATGLCISLFGGQGLCLDTELDIDLSDITPGTSDVYGIHANAAAATVDPEIVNSTVRLRNTKSGKWYGFVRFNSTSLSLDFPGTSGTTSRIVNSVFISDAPTTGATCRLLLGDVLSPSGVFRNNAVHGFSLGGAGDEGYSSWIDTVVLQSPVQLGALDNRLAGLGSTAYGGYAEIDRLGRPLASPGVSIGPWGVTAGDYDQAWRFSLTPAQLARLEAAGTALQAADYTEPLDAAETQAAAEDAIDAKLPSGATMIAGAGDTAETLDDIETGGAATPVYARVIHDARVWQYDDRSRSRPVDIVTVKPGFVGRLAFAPALNEGAAVATVTSVTLNESATGISELGPSGDYTQATFKTAALAAGVYEVEAVITTTDGETLPLAATLRVE
jgi:hypothetical protein